MRPYTSPAPFLRTTSEWVVEYSGGRSDHWVAVRTDDPSIRLEAEGEDNSAIYAAIEDWEIERANEAAERAEAA